MMNRDLGTLCLFCLPDNLHFGNCTDSVGKDANVAFGGENEYVWVGKELFIQMCNILTLRCSMCLFISQICFTRMTPLVPCAAWSGQHSHGLHVY